MFGQKKETKQERLTPHDIDILLQTLREISKIIHHQMGVGEKWRLFRASIVQVMKDHPNKRKALEEFFGDVEKGELSKNGKNVFEDLIAIRNFPHEGKFHQIFITHYDGDRTEFAKDIYGNLKRFRKFIARYHNKVPGLWNLMKEGR